MWEELFLIKVNVGAFEDLFNKISSNELIQLKVYSDSFYARFYDLRFPNMCTLKGKPLVFRFCLGATYSLKGAEFSQKETHFL